jgi:hypothetical protein
MAVRAAAAGHQVIKIEFGGKMTPANVLADGVVVCAGVVADFTDHRSFHRTSYWMEKVPKHFSPHYNSVILRVLSILLDGKCVVTFSIPPHAVLVEVGLAV